MKLTGKIEVFKNAKGYITGIVPSIKDKKLLGKSFIQVYLPKDIEVKEGQTLTLNVKDAYLNSVHVENEQQSFEKLVVAVNEAEVISVYPEPVKTKKKA